MFNTLLISVRFHDGCYHGSGEWPPSPARLFQALVAGAARGESLRERAAEAFQWLESLAPPVIAAPSAHAGRGFKNFVPNNDLDAVGGNPARIGEIRAAKIISRRHFDVAIPLLYAWTFEHSADTERNARTICDIADNLYQLGRGVDMAWAQADVLEESETCARLREHGGALRRPNKAGQGAALLCPHVGSLTSLAARFAARRTRFKTVDNVKTAGQLFSQPPKPSFSQIPYDSPSTFLLFDIRKADAFAPRPLERVVTFTERIRDQATARLKKGLPNLPNRAALVDRVFIGRNAIDSDKTQRIRITPLPSIGHSQTERSVRRMLVAVPPDCPIATSDIAWAFSGLAIDFDLQTGEAPNDGAMLVAAEDRTMLGNYGVESGAKHCVWRSVTPAALPECAARRRIDPRRMREAAKDGAECLREHAAAEWAVRQALRHASICTNVERIRVQREPFEPKGARAESFAATPRFAKERLWHVEIAFADPISGPLIIGDGRYLGLGLMAPARTVPRDVLAFPLPRETRIANAARGELLRAVRRALMSLAHETSGDVPVLFSGHEVNGERAASGQHRHVFLAVGDLDGDGYIDEIVIAAPWACDRYSTPQRDDRRGFERVAMSLEIVRAGRLGVIALGKPRAPNSDEAMTSRSRSWESTTPYRPTRHIRRCADAAEAVSSDAIAECARRGLPRPDVEVLEFSSGPNGGALSARLRLKFAVAVEGPIFIGRDSHAGGGAFVATQLLGSRKYCS